MGSNIGKRKSNLNAAYNLIQDDVGAITEASAMYRTEAWGPVAQMAFYNQVVRINTPLSPHNLLKKVLYIEEKMGRIKDNRWGPRIIDIDILYYHDKIINQRHLTLPHPQIPNRKFALVPLCEIAPDFRHPALGMTNDQLLKICTDQMAVRRLGAKP